VAVERVQFPDRSDERLILVPHAGVDCEAVRRLHADLAAAQRGIRVEPLPDLVATLTDRTVTVQNVGNQDVTSAIGVPQTLAVSATISSKSPDASSSPIPMITDVQWKTFSSSSSGIPATVRSASATGQNVIPSP